MPRPRFAHITDLSHFLMAKDIDFLIKISPQCGIDPLSYLQLGKDFLVAALSEEVWRKLLSGDKRISHMIEGSFN